MNYSPSDLAVIIKAQVALSYLYAPINQEVFDDIVEEMVAVEAPQVETIIEQYEDSLSVMW